MMQWRLNQDVAQLQRQGMLETKKLNASDLYEISNLRVLVQSRRSGDDGKNEGKAGLLLSHPQQVLQVGGPLV